MGRRSLLPLCLVLAIGGGCASRLTHVSRGERPAGDLASDISTGTAADQSDEAMPASASASALVFRPPVAAGEPAPDLSRAARQPSAFVGFEEPILEFYNVTTIDRQVAGGWSGRSGSGFGWGGSGGASCDRYERRAVTEKVGVLHR